MTTTAPPPLSSSTSSSSSSSCSFSSLPPLGAPSSNAVGAANCPNAVASGSVPATTETCAGRTSSTSPSCVLDLSFEDVHVYVSQQTIAARMARRKEREALEPSTGGSSGEGGDKPLHVLRERTSFMNLNKILLGSPTQATVGPWRRATLRLREQGARPPTRLPVYLLQIHEEGFRTDIYLQQLASTDIRTVHSTLFHLHNCLGIYNTASYAATSPPDTPLEPVYLHFPSRATLGTWLALFRSCVRPETYGVQLSSPTQGGLYRMWRAINLTLVSGCNIGSNSSSSSSTMATSAEKERARKEVNGNLNSYGRIGYGGGANPVHIFSSGASSASGSIATGASTSGITPERGIGKGKDRSTSSANYHPQLNPPSMNDDKELSPSEDDIFCTIYVAGELSARSSIQGAPPKSENALMPPPSANNTPIWNENFRFDPLPPFNDMSHNERSENNVLRILVYRMPRKSNLERLVQGAMRNVTPPTSHFGSALDASAHSQPSSSSTLSSKILAGSLSPSTTAFDLHNPSASGSSASTAQNQILIGKVEIPLGSFRRGEPIDSHWPIVPDPIGQSCRSHSSILLGELRLKIRVDEECILPQDRYTALRDALKNGNCVLFGTEIEKRIKPTLLGFTPSEFQKNIFWMNAGRGICVKDTCDALSMEIAASTNNTVPLLRAASPATYWAQRVMAYVGQEFINASVGPVIHQLVDRNIYFETERTSVSEKVSDKELGTSVKECVKWCNEMWNTIYNRRDECPQEIRRILAHVRTEVDRQYAGKKDLKALRLQGVIALIFLRLVIPAILDPRKHLITHGTPSPLVRRSLIQIAKIIQALANMNRSSAKVQYSEDYQRPILDFLASNSDAMNDYILVVSKPKPPAWVSEVLDPQEQAAQEHIAALKQLETNLPTLHRESIPDLNSKLDIARCLASVASTVARSSALNLASELLVRPGAAKPRDQDRDAEATTDRTGAVISACCGVERDVAKTVARVEARSDKVRPRSIYSPSVSSVSPQFQSFALSSLAVLPPLHPPLASLQFTAPNTMDFTMRRGSRDQVIPGSPELSQVQGGRPLSTMLEVPATPLDRFNAASSGRPPSSSPEPPPESPTTGKQRRKSIVKSPSRGELNRSATRKRSGLLRSMLPGRRDE